MDLEAMNAASYAGSTITGKTRQQKQAEAAEANRSPRRVSSAKFTDTGASTRFASFVPKHTILTWHDMSAGQDLDYSAWSTQRLFLPSVTPPKRPPRVENRRKEMNVATRARAITSGNPSEDLKYCNMAWACGSGLRAAA